MKKVIFAFVFVLLSVKAYSQVFVCEYKNVAYTLDQDILTATADKQESSFLIYPVACFISSAAVHTTLYQGYDNENRRVLVAIKWVKMTRWKIRSIRVLKYK